MHVIKRSGIKEKFSENKLRRILEWADILHLYDIIVEYLYDNIKTIDLHNIIIKICNDMGLDRPASKLQNFKLRKEVYGSIHIPTLYDHIKSMVDQEVYDEELLTKWNKSHIESLQAFIDHDRDFEFSYGGIVQMIDKYLIRDRISGKIYETPQMAYMCISMILFDTIYDVKTAYDLFSRHVINLPTPVLAGVRSKIRQYASCVLIDVDDDLDSIFASVHAVGRYTARRAGIGLNVGRIRPIKSPIRGGEVIHSGLIPYLKIFEATTKATSQNGIRGGSATVHVPYWHYEIEDVVVLKNNAGTDDNRVRNMDYSIQFDKEFYTRVINNQDITLFNPHEVPGLYESFGTPDFRDLYIRYENDPSIKQKKKIPARKLAELFARERLETGRIYVMHIDNANIHGSWNIPVHMSNLCQEIIHPTVPIKDINDPNGEIGICVLAALNLLRINDKNIRDVCSYTVRMLDKIIDYQDYPVPAGRNFATNRRSLGIGITNFAAWLAANKVGYTQEAFPLVHEMMEKIQWHLINASCELAMVKGPCNKFEDTKYAQGLLPVDWYKKELDAICKPKYNMDWETLRAKVKKYGLRNSTLTAIMPCESSSVVGNMTNGIEPVRALVSYKKSKSGVVRFVAPDHLKYKDYYTIAWDVDNKIVIGISAILQKFVDMSISTNLYYNYEKYEDNMIPLSEIILDQLYAYKMGIKNLYYLNTPDGDGKIEKSCVSGSCTI